MDKKISPIWGFWGRNIIRGNRNSINASLRSIGLLLEFIHCLKWYHFSKRMQVENLSMIAKQFWLFQILSGLKKVRKRL